MTETTIRSGRLIPAAQYIRMSTEHQKFSPDNQRAANAAYAAAHGYEIVATYQDSGKSGLTLQKRPELKRLLSDVLSGTMPYKAILVLDVSRWGRFQDADQAAHYEFMCREAGVPVRYCSEAFDNDGGAMSAIVKHMKRVMAAEYSRELSVKVSRAKRLQAGLGYRQGSHPPYGTCRLLIDERGKPQKVLSAGQMKSVSSHRVILAKGDPQEVAMVRQIYRMFAIDGKSVKEVRERLNATGKFDRGGRPWTSSRLLRILNNKIYSGVSIFGKQLNNLGQPKPLPRSQWIISKVMEPIVPDEITRAVSEKFESMRRRNWTKDAVKAGLRRLLRERGYISYPAIEEAAYLPSSSVILRNFGDITELCRTIGYEKPRRACRFHARIYTDDELLTEIIRIHRQQGSITGRAIDEDTKSPSSAYFALRFGGLRNAYLAAGLMASQPGQIPPNRRVKARLFSNDELLKGLGELLAQAGFLSCSLINQEPSLPQAEVFCRRFGTLSKAYELIGYRQSRAEVLRLSKAYQESAEAERRGAALN